MQFRFTPMQYYESCKSNRKSIMSVCAQPNNTEADGHHHHRRVKVSSLSSFLSVVLMKLCNSFLLVLLLASPFTVATEGMGDPEYLAQFDTCETDDDCLNGGSCGKNELVGTPDMCSCLMPYHGELCENFYCNLDCQAGGVCKVLPSELSWQEVCDCPDDRLGKLCQWDANDPLAHLHYCDDDDDCQNGGTCEEPTEFEVLRTCDCQDGFTGDLCEHVVDVVESSVDPPTINATPPSSEDDPKTPSDRENPAVDNDDNSKSLPAGAKIGLGVGATVSVIFVSVWLALWAKKRLGCAPKAQEGDGDGLHKEQPADSTSSGADPENQEGGQVVAVEEALPTEKENLPDVI
mmetsp:Transcript_13641/g.26075  ORF Transcript_13641/g.26075 Transcript_13641/m.26075 type:complete len:348 (-) Transcript_13641:135-1178(-)